MPDPEVPVLREAQEDVRRLAEALRLALRRRRLTLVEASRRLGHYPEYLGRVLSGRALLKVRDVFDVLALLEIHPQEFFDIYFPLGGPAVTGLRELATEEENRARAVARGLLRRGLGQRDQGLDSAAWVRRTGQLAREMIERRGRSQRELSLEFGLASYSLGQRLRGTSRLLCWQLFAVLRALEVDPGRFFVELVFPDTTLSESLRLSQVLDLWETRLRPLSEASLAKRKARLEPKGDRPKPTESP
jgi:hypothetical protein